MSSIEGIPEGWELVRVGKLMPGDYWLNSDGLVVRWDSDHQSAAANYVVIRKIVKPKTYRPFANAAEFKPHRDRWWRYSDSEDSEHLIPPSSYSKTGPSGSNWRQAFEYRQFDDGTPFGVEVTE